MACYIRECVAAAAADSDAQRRHRPDAPAAAFGTEPLVQTRSLSEPATAVDPRSGVPHTS